MDFLIFIPKRLNPQFHSRSAILAVCIIAITFLAACNGEKGQSKLSTNDTTRTKQTTATNPTEQLHSLYLEKRQLLKLLNATHGTDKADRIVFQYFHDKNGDLTLVAWPHNGRDYDYGNQPLNISTKVDTSIAGEDVGLGRISLNQSNFKMLSEMILKNPNDPSYNYFIFTPSITTDLKTKLNSVMYKIHSSASLNKILFTSGFSIDLNPSPPGKADN